MFAYRRHSITTWVQALVLVFCTAVAVPQAKFEPNGGCYVGAFIVNDTGVRDSVELFETLTRKKHSIYFSYAGYGTPFPSTWITKYASKGAIVQVAFEPNNGLAEVTDSPYIRSWAQAARRSGAMILLRWASEMNGSWVAWYGNPSLYIEKFRLMHNIMAQEAPNVALVWCPNDVPNDPLNPTDYIHSYYPGDAYVDWVGIDFYGVYYYENGAPERGDPRDKLNIVYSVYSSRKPIIICEWAAAHVTGRVSPPETCTVYALDQIDRLYVNAEAQFPRLKAICWFNWNTMATANRSNFSLTDDPSVLARYGELMQDPYFLSAPLRTVPSIAVQGVPRDSIFRSDTTLTVRITCDVPLDSVVFRIDGQSPQRGTSSLFQLPLLLTTLAEGTHQVDIRAWARSGFDNFERLSVVTDRFFRYQVIDNVDSSFSTIGTWVLSGSQPDRYGTNYFYSSSAYGPSRAVWTPTIVIPGRYDVYAWWSVAANRSTNAPYVIAHAYGIDTVRVNQQMNGGRWNLLGSYSFRPAPPPVISLTNDADNLVIADGVRIMWKEPTAVTGPRTASPPISLSHNYPNPFNPFTTIEYVVPKQSHVRLDVYSVQGEAVITLIDELHSPGRFVHRFNAAGLASGVYLCRMQACGQTLTRKLLVVK